jgi:glucose/arabinose dehydrogenase
MQTRSIIFAALLLLAASPAPGLARQASDSPRLAPRRVALAGGRAFELNVPEGFGVSVAAEGLRRVRFVARSPDGRIFVTDMHSLADNTRGVVYALDDFDPARRRFLKVTPYLTRLRNPNSIAFHTDRRGVQWLYLALTDRLVRYRYEAGDEKPSGEPEVLATFPDYGLGYKYGGWHLTRTIAFGEDGRLYVSVGSSCNACVEKEEVRASVLVMDEDGQNRRHFARGLRNAVGLRWARGRLYATNMGADHLGDHRPADTLHALREGAHYGWPFCYQSGARRLADRAFNPGGRKFRCRDAGAAFAAFDAHSSPLGLEYFGDGAAAELRDSFLVALHGSTKKGLERGHRVVRVRGGAAAAQADFVTGFRQRGKVYGRPVDIFALGPDSFLLTDDHAGAVYYVYRT